MSDTDFLKAVKAQLTKALIGIVITFIGAVTVTIFTVKGQEKEIDTLKSDKADKVIVEQQFDNVNDNLEEIKSDIREGQRLIIELLRE